MAARTSMFVQVSTPIPPQINDNLSPLGRAPNLQRLRRRFRFEREQVDQQQGPVVDDEPDQPLDSGLPRLPDPGPEEEQRPEEDGH